MAQAASERSTDSSARFVSDRSSRMTRLYPLSCTTEGASARISADLRRLGMLLVRSRRLELPRSFPHSDLNAARLPIPPRPHVPYPLRIRRERGACLAKARYHIKPDGPRYGHGRGGNRVAAHRSAGALAGGRWPGWRAGRG